MRLFAVGVLLVSALAGCSNAPSGDPAQPDDPQAAGVAAGSVIPLPTWEVGDWWRWRSPQADEPATYVVSAITASDYIVDTDEPGNAFFDATNDISMLGPNRKSDLAGSQGSDRIEFLRFPLQAHMNWTTRWDQQTLTIHVMEVEGGLAMMHATREDGALHAMYTFDNDTGHFASMAFYGDDGQVAYESQVEATGKGFTGDLVRWDLEVAYEHEGAMGAQSTTYQVPAGITDVYARIDVQCTTGAFNLATGPPQGPAEDRGYAANVPCPFAANDAGTLSLGPAQDETWGLLLAAAPDPANVLNMTVWLRTQVTFAPGAAPPLA